MVLHMNWDYVSGKKQKWKIKTKEQKREKTKIKQIQEFFIRLQLSDGVYTVTFPAYDIYSLRRSQYIS
jgi:hypothetical protein